MNLKWTVKRFLLMSFSVSHLLLLEGESVSFCPPKCYMGEIDLILTGLTLEINIVMKLVTFKYQTCYIKCPDYLYCCMLELSCFMNVINHILHKTAAAPSRCGFQLLNNYK